MREFFVRQNLSIRAILGAIRAIWMVCPPFENVPVRLWLLGAEGGDAGGRERSKKGGYRGN